jgi:hypothetical protein
LHFFSPEINNIGATVPCMHHQRGFAADIPTHTVSATHNHDGVCFKVELTFRMLHTSMLIVLTIRRIPFALAKSILDATTIYLPLAVACAFNN